MSVQNPCQEFERYTSFEAFVAALKNEYENVTAAVMEGCREEICTTLYSTGNTDVSGIGVSRFVDPESFW